MSSPAISPELERRSWPAPGWRVLSALAVLGAMFGLYLLSAQSRLPQPELPLAGLDKLQHALAYALLGAAAQAACGVRRGEGSILPAVILVVAYAVFDELHQARVPGRDASAFDALADFGGAVLGAVWVRWLAARRGHRGK
jgi:VanZ family protein